LGQARAPHWRRTASLRPISAWDPTSPATNSAF
jgi:hypothetical protein